MKYSRRSRATAAVRDTMRIKVYPPGSGSHLPPQDAVHHDDDEALQRVEDGEEDLKEDGALVRHGEHGRHPGESQQGQDHAGAPQRCPGGRVGTGRGGGVSEEDEVEAKVNLLAPCFV